MLAAVCREAERRRALPITVVGIMPAAFDFPRGADVFVPAGPLRGPFAAGPGEPERNMKWLKVSTPSDG